MSAVERLSSIKIMKIVYVYFMNNKQGKMKYVSAMENSVMREQVVRVL